MAFNKIADSHPKYLAAADILIGDMSSINYEYLLFNRPIILLANQWVRENYPDFGIKTNLKGLLDSIYASISNPSEFSDQRQRWLQKTMHNPDGKSSARVLDTIISRCGIQTPMFIFVHGGSDVIRHTLNPLIIECTKRNLVFNEVTRIEKPRHKNSYVYISANNGFLAVPFGFKVHLDHGAWGDGVNDFEKTILDWRDEDYYRFTNLHISDGPMSQEKKKILLGPYANRAAMVGYPKSDDLIRLNTKENKILVCAELGFDPEMVLVLYAPAGKYRHPHKQGASLNRDVIKTLKSFEREDFNIFVKLKYPARWLLQRIMNKISSMVTSS